MARVNTGSGWTSQGAASFEQLTAAQTVNVNTDSPVSVTVGRRYTANLAGGSIVYNLPTAPVVDSRVAFSVSAVAGSNTATVNCGGSDRFQTPTTGATSKTLNRVGQVLIAQYQAASAIWLVEEDVALNFVSGYGTFANTATPGDLKVDMQVDVQNYAAGTYTWNAPSWATANSTVEVIVVGAGGGGGTGRRGAASSIRGGGGGAQAGFRSQATFKVSDLTTPVTVTVGAGGTGGAQNTVDSTDGANGNPGNPSFFGKYVYASGGAGGSGGTSTDGGAGGTTVAGSRGLMPGMPGMRGAGINPGQDPNATQEFATFAVGQITPNAHSSGCGGGGAGSSAANSNIVGSSGGDVNGYTDGTTLGGTAGTGSFAGNPGVAADAFTASGGGGGGRANTGNSLAGGPGGTPGGGGGGSGGATNGFMNGTGGLGGDGFIRVTTRP